MLNRPTHAPLRITAFAVLAAALMTTGCDRQPRPDTVANVDPTLNSGASDVSPKNPEGVPAGDGVQVADAQTPAGTGIGTARDPLGVPPSATTNATSGPSNDATAVSPSELPPTSAGKPAASDKALDPADKAFVTTAAADGDFEVQAGKLAAQQGKDETVKAFGAMLSSDHTSAGTELKALAAAKGVTLTSVLPNDKQSTLDALGRATGSDFDHQFVRTVGIRAHQDAVALFEKASKEAKDPDIKAFAAKTLPTLKAHLDAARKLPGGSSKS